MTSSEMAKYRMVIVPGAILYLSISRVYHFLPPFTIAESTFPTRQIPVFIDDLAFLTFLPTPANWLVGLFTLLYPYFMSDSGPIPRSLVSIISHYLDFDSGRFFFSTIYACNYSLCEKSSRDPIRVMKYSKDSIWLFTPGTFFMSVSAPNLELSSVRGCSVPVLVPPFRVINRCW